MATKTIAIAVQIEGDAQLRQLQANFDQVRRARIELNKAEKAGTVTAKQANAERAKLNVQLKANRNALTDHQNALLKNNNALKKNSGFVSGVKKGMGQWATSMIGVTAAIAGVTRLVSGAVKIFVDFQKANSELAAVSRASAEEMKAMSTQAKELGASTAFTASQVTELQTNFARLGFPTQDIQNMTEATLNGAAALGSDLGEQAALTGALLKQFGLDSEEAGRVNDVLAESAAKSALDFSKLSTALPIVGATANTAGVSIERTTALLGTLSDRGLDASTSGTSLRNIFLELSKKGLTFDEAMKQINDSTDKNKTAMDLFGKRSATAGIILAETGQSVDSLEGSLINAEGAAKKMADTMLDNVSGDVTKAQSAYEGFILSLEDGNGVISDVIRNVTQLATSYLGIATAINEAETAQEAFNAIGSIWGEEIGVFNEQTAEYSKNLADNANNIAVLDERLANNKITQEQYNLAIQKLATGWKRASKEIKEADDTISGVTDTVTESTELTPEQVTRINDKAKKAAEVKAQAQKDALKAIEEQEAADTEGEQGVFDAEILKNENLLAIDKEYLDAKKLQLDESIAAEIAAEEKKAQDLATIEQLKRDARQATFGLTADLFNLGASLAAEGSREQKALASAAALIQTYQAAQAAYLSQLSIPTPTAPIRAAAAASIAVASGLANVAKINSTKFEGGAILQGASHANGGIPFTIDGQAGFEAEGGEAIINKRSTEMFAPLLSAINEAGGGVAFGRGGRLTKFQNGGSLPTNVGVTASQQGFASGVIDLEEFSSAIVDGINDKEVINVATNTTDSASEVLNIASEATF
jgi:hypothetical protein